MVTIDSINQVAYIGPNKMTLVQILGNFRARNVTFTLKGGTKRTIFVNEIEDESDDQPETLFMADDPKDDVWISDVVSATALQQVNYKPVKKQGKIEKSEKKAINVLKNAFNTKELYMYTFTIQDYFADETDQLAIDNPKMEDYLNDVIPEFTEAYDETKKWLNDLKKIIKKAELLA